MAGAISDQTTCLSNLSLTGNLSASSISLVNGALSVSTIAGSAVFSGAVVTGSTVSAVGQISAGLVSSSVLTASTSVNIGGGTSIVHAFASLVSIAAVVCQATSSTSTLISGLNSCTTFHFLTIHPPSGSGSSSGIVYNVQPGSAASTAVLTLSNASTVAATLAVQNWRISGIRYSGI